MDEFFKYNYLTKLIPYSNISNIREVIMYDLNKIKDCLTTDYIGQTIIQFDELKSTFAKSKNIFDTCPNGAIVLSEDQHDCKIRFNRKWISKRDKNIYFSIILKPYDENYSISKFESISCACIFVSVKDICNTNCQIKWPNDIFINGKKIASISCDEIKIKNKNEGIIITFNINVNDFFEKCVINEKNGNNNIEENNQIDYEHKNQTNNDELNEIASSIKTETDQEVDREQLIGCMLNCFEKYVQELLINKNIDEAVNIINTYSLLNNTEILVVKYKKKSFRKLTALSVDSEGWLLAINEKGNEEIINSGEITVKYDNQKN